MDTPHAVQYHLDELKTEYDLLENAAVPDYERMTALQIQIARLTSFLESLRKRPVNRP
jgi:hypothetical protein